MARKKSLELYIHIPFCVRKCLYCDFLSASCCGQEQAEYMDQLRSEILASGPWYEGYEVETVFIGGGTPYYMTYVDNAWYLTEHRLSGHSVWRFQVTDNKITDVEAVY